MELTARPKDCFATRCALRLDGEPIGTLRSRAFRDTIEAHLRALGRAPGRARLVFERRMRGRYVLADAASGETLAEAKHHFWKGHWTLWLACGERTLRSRGLFRSGHDVVDGEGRPWARVDREKGCGPAWRALALREMALTDLLAIGLTHHLIARRQAQASSTSAATVAATS